MIFFHQFKWLVLTLIASSTVLTLTACHTEQEQLIVYSGKGLKLAMEDIRQAFEKQEGIPVSIIYSGSNSLYNTLKNSRKGDVFIPGAQSYIKKGGSLIDSSQFVAYHIPTFMVLADGTPH